MTLHIFFSSKILIQIFGISWLCCHSQSSLCSSIPRKNFGDNFQDQVVKSLADTAYARQDFFGAKFPGGSFTCNALIDVQLRICWIKDNWLIRFRFNRFDRLWFHFNWFSFYWLCFLLLKRRVFPFFNKSKN